jgi:hypothetical protein
MEPLISKALLNKVMPDSIWNTSSANGAHSSSDAASAMIVSPVEQ